MNKPINFQTILGSDGHPAFVVVPYHEFVRRFDETSDLVPDAVVKLALDNKMSPSKAWRSYLGMTQDEVAKNMGLTQSAYAQLENSAKLKVAPRQKIAAALGIRAEQLDF
jgi:DNA-binding XRE family transcriptional regulator